MVRFGRQVVSVDGEGLRVGGQFVGVSSDDGSMVTY